MTTPGKDPDTGPPFPGHRRYYLFVKVAIALMVLWLFMHFMGVLP